MVDIQRQNNIQRGNNVVGEQVSDDFGDFKFDDLADDSGDYELIIMIDEKIAKRRIVTLSNDQSVGTIRID